MIIKIKYPKGGDTRIRKHFCLFPKIFWEKEEKYMAWLSPIYIKEEYYIPSNCGPYWRTIKISTKKFEGEENK